MVILTLRTLRYLKARKSFFVYTFPTSYFQRAELSLLTNAQ